MNLLAENDITRLHIRIPGGDRAEKGSETADKANGSAGGRADLTSALTADLLQKMTDKDWIVRRDAIQSFESILVLHHKFVLPRGLSPFIGILKKNLSDSNSSVVTSSLSALGTIGESIGEVMERTIATLIPSVFACFDVSRRSITQAAYDCVRVWIEKAGVTFSSIVPHLGDPIGRPSCVRGEFLSWIHLQMKDLSVTVPVDHLVTPILHSLIDRDEDVKSAGTSLLRLLCGRIGSDAIQTAIESDTFSVSAKRTLIPILQSVSSEKQSGVDRGEEKAKTGAEEKGAGAAVGDGSREKKCLKKPTTGRKRDDDDDALSLVRNTGKKDIRSIQNKSHPWKDLIGFSEEAMRSRGEESATFSGIRQEMMTSFSMELLTCASPSLHFLLSSSDPLHIKSALDYLEPLTASAPSTESSKKEEIFESLDVLLKWGTLRLSSLLSHTSLSSSSPSVSLSPSSLSHRLLLFLLSLLHFLMRNDRYLSNYEAEIIIPFLLHLSPAFPSPPPSSFLSVETQPKTPKREGEGDAAADAAVSLHTYFEVLSKIFPASKLFGFLVDALVDPSRVTSPSMTPEMQEEVTQYLYEILTETGSLLRRHGLTVCKPSAALPAIASHISDPRDIIQKAAVAAIGEAYAHGRDRIWMHLTSISEESRGVILEHLRSIRDLPTSTTPHSMRSTNGRRTPSSASSASTSSSAVSSESETISLRKLDESSVTPLFVAPSTSSLSPSPSVHPPVSISTVGSWVETLQRKDESRKMKETIVTSIAREAEREESVFSLYAERITLSLLSLMEEEEGGEKEEDGFVYLILGAMSALFKGKTVSSSVSSRTLNSLIETILSNLSEEREREADAEKDAAKVRAWETLMSLVLANAKQTFLFSSLLFSLRSLLSSPSSARSSLCVTYLSLKTEHIASGCDDSDLNYKHLLREIHLYFTEESTVRKANGSELGVTFDASFEAVFCLLKAIVQRKGDETLRLLSLIPSHPTPIVVTHIHSILKGNSDESNEPAHSHTLSQPQLTEPNPSSSSSLPLPPSLSAPVTFDLTPELILILKTIREKETTMKGLHDLLAYKRDRGIDDVAPYLSRLSQKFQGYILSALSALEKKEERERREREERERREREEKEREGEKGEEKAAKKTEEKPTENAAPNTSLPSSSSLHTPSHLCKTSERAPFSAAPSPSPCISEGKAVPVSLIPPSSSSSSSLPCDDTTTSITALRQRLALMRQQAGGGQPS